MARGRAQAVRRSVLQAARRAGSQVRDGGWRRVAGSRTGVVVALAALVLIAAVALIAVGVGPRSPIADAADDLSGWPAATYRGVLTDSVGATATVALTVLEDGPAYGVVEGPSGARAQVVRDGDRIRTKANRAWWRYLDAPEVLAGSWVDDPSGLPALLVSDGVLTPSSVARQLTADEVGPWSPAGDRLIGTHDGRVLSASPAREVVVGADDGGTLLWLSVPLGRGGSADPEQGIGISAVADLEVVRPSDGELERLRAYTSTVLSEPDSGADARSAGGCPATQSGGC